LRTGRRIETGVRPVMTVTTLTPQESRVSSRGRPRLSAASSPERLNACWPMPDSGCPMAHGARPMTRDAPAAGDGGGTVSSPRRSRRRRRWGRWIRPREGVGDGGGTSRRCPSRVPMNSSQLGRTVRPSRLRRTPPKLPHFVRSRGDRQNRPRCHPWCQPSAIGCQQPRTLGCPLADAREPTPDGAWREADDARGGTHHVWARDPQLASALGRGSQW
jgi:hypothetical protein